MTLNSIRFALFVSLGLTVSLGAACMPASTTPMDGGGDTGGGGPTYTKDVQPILAAKCGPCHTTQGMGQHNVAADYDEVHHPVVSIDAQGCWADPDNMTGPKTIGECSWISIMRGWMPFASGCGGTDPLDPSLCLTDAQKATIQAWVTAGMPE
jgi:hypothetical protein